MLRGERGVTPVLSQCVWSAFIVVCLFVVVVADEEGDVVVAAAAAAAAHNVTGTSPSFPQKHHEHRGTRMATATTRSFRKRSNPMLSASQLLVDRRNP